MSISKTLHTVVRVIPETDETAWGLETTNLLVEVTETLEETTCKTAAGDYYPKLETTSQTLAGSATLTPLSCRVKLTGSGGAVTLDSTTAIADGEFEGQILELQGTSDSNTVTIWDASNVGINGDITLYQDTVISLIWDVTRDLWVERFRN